MVAVVGLLISSQIRLTELNSEKNRKEAELNQVISETKRLESELAARTSAQSVEEYAQATACKKWSRARSSTLRSRVTEDDQTMGTEAEPGFWESLWDAIAGFFGGGS